MNNQIAPINARKLTTVMSFIASLGMNVGSTQSSEPMTRAGKIYCRKCGYKEELCKCKISS